MAICGDIMHSRVARSNIHLLQIMGARVRVVGPPTLMPTDVDRWNVQVFHDMRKGVAGRASEMCPIGACMELLGGAWTPNVIWHLQGGPRRFSELEADMKPISAKVRSLSRS